MYPFNVRVYGLLINDRNEILISDEQEYGMRFAKFPGGGLEHGEGLIDGLKREFVEECNVEIEVLSHFYTTDFYIKSAFNDSQIISVYYLVKNISPLALAFKLGRSADVSARVPELLNDPRLALKGGPDRIVAMPLTAQPSSST